MRSSKALLLLIALCWAVSPLRAQSSAQTVKALRFGKLVDGAGKVVTNAVVVVKGNRIDSIGNAESQIPPGAQVIDLSEYTGMPGIMDVHTHLTYWWDKDTRKNPNAEV